MQIYTDNNNKLIAVKSPPLAEAIHTSSPKNVYSRIFGNENTLDQRSEEKKSKDNSLQLVQINTNLRIPQNENQTFKDALSTKQIQPSADTDPTSPSSRNYFIKNLLSEDKNFQKQYSGLVFGSQVQNIYRDKSTEVTQPENNPNSYIVELSNINSQNQLNNSPSVQFGQLYFQNQQSLTNLQNQVNMLSQKELKNKQQNSLDKKQEIQFSKLLGESEKVNKLIQHMQQQERKQKKFQKTRQINSLAIINPNFQLKQQIYLNDYPYSLQSNDQLNMDFLETNNKQKNPLKIQQIQNKANHISYGTPLETIEDALPFSSFGSIQNKQKIHVVIPFDKNSTDHKIQQIPINLSDIAAAQFKQIKYLHNTDKKVLQTLRNVESVQRLSILDSNDDYTSLYRNQLNSRLQDKQIPQRKLSNVISEIVNDEQKESEGGNEMIFENESLKITFSHKKVQEEKQDLEQRKKPVYNQTTLQFLGDLLAGTQGSQFQDLVLNQRQTNLSVPNVNDQIQSGGFNMQKLVNFDKNNIFVCNHVDQFVRNKNVTNKSNRIQLTGGVPSLDRGLQQLLNFSPNHRLNEVQQELKEIKNIQNILSTERRNYKRSRASLPPDLSSQNQQSFQGVTHLQTRDIQLRKASLPSQFLTKSEIVTTQQNFTVSPRFSDYNDQNLMNVVNSKIKKLGFHQKILSNILKTNNQKVLDRSEVKENSPSALETIVKNGNLVGLSNLEMNSFRNKVHQKEIQNSPGGQIQSPLSFQRSFDKQEQDLKLPDLGILSTKVSPKNQSVNLAINHRDQTQEIIVDRAKKKAKIQTIIENRQALELIEQAENQIKSKKGILRVDLKVNDSLNKSSVPEIKNNLNNFDTLNNSMYDTDFKELSILNKIDFNDNKFKVQQTKNNKNTYFPGIQTKTSQLGKNEKFEMNEDGTIKIKENDKNQIIKRREEVQSRTQRKLSFQNKLSTIQQSEDLLKGFTNFGEVKADGKETHKIVEILKRKNYDLLVQDDFNFKLEMINGEILKEINQAQEKVDGLFDRIYKKEEEKKYYKTKKKQKSKIASKSPTQAQQSPQEIQQEILSPQKMQKPRYTRANETYSQKRRRENVTLALSGPLGASNPPPLYSQKDKKIYEFLQRLDNNDQYPQNAIQQQIIKRVVEFQKQNIQIDKALISDPAQDQIINGLCLLQQITSKQIRKEQIDQLREQASFRFGNVVQAAKNLQSSIQIVQDESVYQSPNQLLKKNLFSARPERNSPLANHNSRIYNTSPLRLESVKKVDILKVDNMNESEKQAYDVFNSKIFSKVIEQIIGKNYLNRALQRKITQNLNLSLFKKDSNLLKDLYKQKNLLLVQILNLNEEQKQQRSEKGDEQLDILNEQLDTVNDAIIEEEKRLDQPDNNAMLEYAMRNQGEQSIYQFARKINNKYDFFTLYKNFENPFNQEVLETNPAMSFINNNINDHQFTLPILSKISNKELILIDYQLNNSNCKSLAQAFKASPNIISSLTLINNNCKDLDMKEILTGVQNLDHIQTIIYKDNEFQYESLCALRPILTKQKPYNLEELRLINCKIGASFTHDLLDLLLEGNYLKKLSLVKINLSIASFQKLLQLIQESTILIELDLSCNDFLQKQMCELIAILSNNRKLVNVNLSWNSIIDPTPTVIPTVLEGFREEYKFTKKQKNAAEKTLGQLGDLVLDMIVPQREQKLLKQSMLDLGSINDNATQISDSYHINSSIISQTQIEQKESSVQAKEETIEILPTLPSIIVQDSQNPQNDQEEETQVPIQPQITETEQRNIPTYLLSEAEIIALERSKLQTQMQKLITKQLGDFVKYNINLQHFDLSFTGLNDSCLKKIILGIKKSRSLLSLHLNGNPGISDKLKQFIFKKIKAKTVKNKVEIDFGQDKQNNPKMRADKKREIIHKNLKIQSIKKEKQANIIGVDINKDFPTKKCEIIRYLGHQHDMPGSAQWDLLDDPFNQQKTCWICEQSIYTLIFWSESIGFKQQAKLSSEKKTKIVDQLLKQYPEVESIFCEGYQKKDSKIYQSQSSYFVQDSASQANTQAERNSIKQSPEQKVNQRLIRQLVYLDSDKERPLISSEFTNWKPIRMFRLDEYCLSLNSKTTRQGKDIFDLAVGDKILQSHVLQHKDINQLNRPEKIAFNKFRDKVMQDYDKIWESFIAQEIRYKKPFVVNVEFLSSVNPDEQIYVFPCFMRPGQQNFIVLQQDGLASQDPYGCQKVSELPEDIDYYYIHKCIVINRKEDPVVFAKPISLEKVRIFKIDQSVFRDRRIDNDAIYDLCLQHDFRLWKLDKFCKEPAEREKVEKVIFLYFKDLKDIFQSLISKSVTFPGMGWFDFYNWLTQIQIFDEKVDEMSLQQIFIASNFEKEKYSQKFNPEHELIRFEFLEAIVRIAKTKFVDPGEIKSLAEATEFLILQYIFLHNPCEVDSDFRVNQLWTLPVNDIIEANLQGLTQIYESYFLPNKKFMNLEDSLDLLIHKTNLLQFEKQVVYCFGMSKMTILNEKKEYRKHKQLTLVEFLEMICRVAELRFRKENSLSFIEKIEFMLDNLLQTIGQTRIEPKLTVNDVSESDQDY